MGELLLFSLVGVALGLVAGILPGLHPNQFFVMLIAMLPSLKWMGEEALVALIISTAISNLFFNYIPSIFFSLPDESTVVNVLPGHRMVLKGKGLDALMISILGAFLTILVIIAYMPFFMLLVPFVHDLFYPYIGILLLLVVAHMVLSEKKSSKIMFALLLFLLSGAWGLVTLNSPMIKSDDALFPTLTGMFGVAGLLASLGESSRMPAQDKPRPVVLGGLVKPLAAGLMAGLLVGVLPGAGEAQAGMLVNEIVKLSNEEFLVALASINASNFLFALVSFLTLGKVRSGSAAAMEKVVSDVSMSLIMKIVGVTLFSAAISALLTWLVGKKLLEKLMKVNYRIVSLTMLIVTVVLVFALTGLVGIFLMTISTFIGFLPLITGVKRTVNMGFLLIPTMFYFLNLNWIAYEVFL